MIIIRLKGGLGNQMFQYALYLQLKALGKDVKIDDVEGFILDKQRKPVLTDTFGITYDKADKQDIIEITDAHMDLISRIRRKLFGRHSTEYLDETGNFDPKIFEMDTAYLNGYFQSDKYFPDKEVIDELKRVYSFDRESVLTNDICWEVYRQIRQTESVSIHVRRGDYLEPGIVESFGGICDIDYYKRTIDYMVQKHPNAEFFVFTSDKEWCEKNVSGEKFHMVDTGASDPDSADMYLMSLCKHHILANSSFSWWSAWINDRENKTILVPSKWLNDKDMRDIYTDRMEKI